MLTVSPQAYMEKTRQLIAQAGSKEAALKIAKRRALGARLISYILLLVIALSFGLGALLFAAMHSNWALLRLIFYR